MDPAYVTVVLGQIKGRGDVVSRSGPAPEDAIMAAGGMDDQAGVSRANAATSSIRLDHRKASTGSTQRQR